MSPACVCRWRIYVYIIRHIRVQQEYNIQRDELKEKKIETESGGTCMTHTECFFSGRESLRAFIRDCDASPGMYSAVGL